jgi:hypothetical protein
MSFSLSNLADKVSNYFKAVEIIEKLPRWNLRVIYYSLDRKIGKKFIIIGEDDLVVNILKNINTKDTVDYIIEIKWRRGGYIIILIGERVRKQVLKRLVLKEKAEILRRVRDY